MCLMPFKKDTGKRESNLYCSNFFKEGEIVYKGTDSYEFKKLCYKAMLDKSVNKYLAKFYSFFIPFAPHWKKKN